MSNFESYYVRQAGSGIPTVYAGAVHQRGHGVGAFLSGILRHIYPFVKMAGKSILTEAARAGLNVVSDVSADVPFKESLRNRTREVRTRLSAAAKRKAEQMQSGQGYKRRKVEQMSQSPASRRRSKVARTQKRKVLKKTRLTKRDLLS